MAVVNLFWELNQCPLVTEKSFNEFVNKMTIAPTFKKDVTLEENMPIGTVYSKYCTILHHTC